MKDKESTANDVKLGFPIRYHVRFPLQNPLPKVTAVILNDKVLCTGPKGFFTTVKQTDRKN